MLRLAKYVKADKFNNKGLFGVGSNQIVFENLEDWNILVKMAHLWLTPSSKNDVFQKMMDRYKITEDKLYKAYNILIEKKFLVKEKNYFNEKDRYSRSYLYYTLTGGDSDLIQKRLKNSTVVVLGCGGIGNNMSYMLASLGVNKIILVDNDKIELTNLTRQFLFTEDDIGKYKIDILERELKKRNSETIIQKYALNINSVKDLYKINDSNIDLFILSADTPFNIIEWMNKYSIDNMIPYINVGYINDISVFGPFVIPGKTACYECMKVAPNSRDIKENELYDECIEINNNFKTATFPPVNNTSASMAMNDVIKYLGDFGEIMSVNKRIGVHSLKIEIEIQDMPKNNQCELCGHL